MYENVRHLMFDALMCLGSDVSLTMVKIREILLQCDALLSVTLIVDRINESVLDGAGVVRKEAIEEVKEALDRNLKFHTMWRRQLEASPSHVCDLLESGDEDPGASPREKQAPVCSLMD